MKRGDIKRLLRAATAERVRLEREKERNYMNTLGWGVGACFPQLEEPLMLRLFKNVPSVWAIAKQINPDLTPSIGAK